MPWLQALIRPRQSTSRTESPSLAWRLGSAFSLSFLLAASLVMLLQLVLTERFSGFVTRLSMEGQTEDIVEGLQFDSNNQVLAVQLEGIDAYAYDAFYANLKFRVLDAKGRVLASSEPRRDSLLADVPIHQQDGLFSVRRLDGDTFYVAAFEREVRGQRLVLQLGRSDRFAELAREAVAPAVGETIGLFTLLAILVSGGAAWWVVRRTLRPIHATVRAAAHVGAQNLSQRLPHAGLPREITPLVQGFNEVLDHLETAFHAQQRFFADAAHELKTPLTLLRTQLERLPREESEPLLRDIDSMARTVQQLLQIAEIDSGHSLQPQHQPMGQIIEGVVRWMSISAERAQVTIDFLQPSEPVLQWVDAGALAVLVKNLLDNAISHSPPGGEVHMRLSPEMLVVEDSGPGVAQQDREHLFERFWRAPGQQRPGAGLGLAIVKDIATAHRWQVRCTTSHSGGARFEVVFNHEPLRALTTPARGSSLTPAAQACSSARE